MNLLGSIGMHLYSVRYAAEMEADNDVSFGREGKRLSFSFSILMSIESSSEVFRGK